MQATAAIYEQDGSTAVRLAYLNITSDDKINLHCTAWARFGLNINRRRVCWIKLKNDFINTN